MNDGSTMLRRKTVIRRYTPDDHPALQALLEREGEEWKDCWQGACREKYRTALEGCIVYLLLEDDVLCGYLRCLNDFGYGIYIHELLVDRESRGMEYGRLLMERVCEDFPEDTVYVMGGHDYYKKLGYGTEGIIYIVRPKK
jgi:ribosomal protein S18 acetylase RimI-like enzyme